MPCNDVPTKKSKHQAHDGEWDVEDDNRRAPLWQHSSAQRDDCKKEQTEQNG
jgi:hypothetical protein